MIAVGNGEPCPYCKGEDKFISQPDNDLMKHLIANHRKEFLATLFETDDTTKEQLIKDGISVIGGNDE